MTKKIQKKSIDFRGQKWNEADEERLYFFRKSGLSYKLIAAKLDRTGEGCRKKYCSTIWEKKPYYNHVLDEGLHEKKKEVYAENELNKFDKKIDTILMRNEIIGDRIAIAISALPKVDPPKYKNVRVAKKTTEDIAVVLSDLHIGHEYTLEETGGISEYNGKIAKQRCVNLMKAVTNIEELHSQLYNIDCLYIFCLGDIVAGMPGVGRWSQTFINQSIYDQVADGCDALANMIYYWLGAFKKIVFCGVRGNHGRVAPLGMEKDYVNWDLICYNYLEQRFMNNDRVVFDVPKTWWMLRKIKGYKFLLVHGDDIKAGTFPVKKLHDFELKMAPIIGEIPDYTIAGHFHNCAEFSTNNGRVLINGGFMGGDVYSIKELHSATKPEQKVFGIHAKHGITWTYNVNLNINR